MSMSDEVGIIVLKGGREDEQHSVHYCSLSL